MGREASVTASLAGRSDQGRLQYEPPKLIFRGAERRVWQGEALVGAQAEAGDLVLSDGARFALGEPFAARWAQAILNPPGRLDKLGVKPGQRVTIVGLQDADFASELAAVLTPLAADQTDLDLLFYAADSLAELAALPGLIPRLAPKGAIWVVSRKGKAAAIKDTDVIAAGRAAGLTDTKVCAFSGTLTALRFVRRK